jgi:hypothetical protein
VTAKTPPLPVDFRELGDASVFEAERFVASVATAETSRTRDATAIGLTALTADASFSSAATVVKLVTPDSESVDRTVLGESE